jgi:hypothetical protein
MSRMSVNESPWGTNVRIQNCSRRITAEKGDWLHYILSPYQIKPRRIVVPVLFVTSLPGLQRLPIRCTRTEDGHRIMVGRGGGGVMTVPNDWQWSLRMAVYAAPRIAPAVAASYGQHC